MPRGQQRAAGSGRGGNEDAQVTAALHDSDGFLLWTRAVFNRQWPKVPAQRRAQCHLLYFAPGLPAEDFEGRPYERGCPVEQVFIGVQWGTFPGLPIMPVDVAQARLPPEAANMRAVRLVGRGGEMAFTLKNKRRPRADRRLAGRDAAA